MTASIRKPFDGEFILTQTFGENPSVYAQFGKPGHNGLDYGLPNGTAVLAAADGTVLKTGYEDGGYGHYVVIQHNGFQTLYAHLRVSYCTKGQFVAEGDVIGLSDNSGFSTGPHLHFELRIPGYAGAYNKGETDPTPFFKVSSCQQSAVDTDAASTSAVTSGMRVKLKTGNDYVNIRNGPGLEYAPVGRLLPEDTEKTVLETKGEWACLLKWAGCELWCNTGYLEVIVK